MQHEPKRCFSVIKGHDAYVEYETIVEAASAEEANQIASGLDYDGLWLRTGDVPEFDDFKVFDERTEACDEPEGSAA